MVRHIAVLLFVLTAGRVSVAPIPDTAQPPVVATQAAAPLPAATPVALIMTPHAPEPAATPVTPTTPAVTRVTAVIALQGFPCGQVVATAEQAETDYAGSCANGNMYRVYLNAVGRVVVEKRK